MALWYKPTYKSPKQNVPIGVEGKVSISLRIVTLKNKMTVKLFNHFNILERKG